MASMILIVSFLLFSGTFLLNTFAQIPSSNLQNALSSTSLSPITTHAPNTTTHAPSTTTHAPNTTTHAPNTTTHAPNTTTHAPNTTTHAPNTTTHAPNTTTHAPNTTTHAPNTTTHAPNTTTHATIQTTTVLPTKPSPPKIGEYKVKDDKGFCIIANMGLEIQIDNSTKDKTDKKYFNIQPSRTIVNGTCGDSKSNLRLEFPEGSINFNFIKESKIYYIDEVSVQLHVTSEERWNGTSGKLKLLTTDVGYSVNCKRTPTVKLGDNLDLLLAEVKLQAFDIKNGTLGKEEKCSYDHNSIAVPIAITVVILVILAIVIYFIWHKKHSAGYERI